MCSDKHIDVFIHMYVYVYYVCGCAQLCPTLCDPVDCNPPGSSVHGIFLARILYCDVKYITLGLSQKVSKSMSEYISIF